MSSDDSARVTLRPPAKTAGTRLALAMRLPFGGSPELANLLTAILARGATALDAAAGAASRAARFLESVGEARIATAPVQAMWSQRSPAGRMVQHGFVVANHQFSRLTGEIRSTDFYSDTKTRPARDIVEFEPDRIDLAPGGAQQIRALVSVPYDAAPGEVLRATFFVAESEQFRVPVELLVGKASDIAPA